MGQQDRLRQKHFREAEAYYYKRQFDYSVVIPKGYISPGGIKTKE